MKARAFAALGLALPLLTAGCSTTNPRPVYHPAASREIGDKLLVVPVEREVANRFAVEGYSRDLAFAFAQRGRTAFDLGSFLDREAAAGRPLPAHHEAMLRRGVVDPEAAAWLHADGVKTLIFFEVQIYEQVWSDLGKRTRVGFSARGRDLSNGEGMWRAFSTPDVVDEPGRGFQLATESAIAALARIISGESEPVEPPRIPFWRWMP